MGVAWACECFGGMATAEDDGWDSEVAGTNRGTGTADDVPDIGRNAGPEGALPEDGPE